jgi:ABC-2 type transport system ATP-binding protein
MKKDLQNNSNRENILKIQNLTKRYGNLVAVDRLDMEVHPGEVFGLLGPNGAGKSTTINMICGLLKPDSGTICIHDKTVHYGSLWSKNLIGVCPQEIVIWNKLTCLEQLQFIGELYNMSSKSARERGQMLLKELGLYEKRNKIGSTLSGGMQRRLNLLIALVHDPEIIILDEPEAGLDPQSRVLVREYIRTMAQRKTIIFTTHNMDEADRVCDRIAILDNGIILATDTPENLKKKYGKGDVLEVHIAETGNTSKAIIGLQRKKISARLIDDSVIIQGREVLSLIPAVVESMRAFDIPIREMHIHENTLEDVFITLTGRRLRE